MASPEASFSMVPEVEETARPLAVAFPSSSPPKAVGSMETFDGANMQLALLTPTKSSERLRPRTTMPTYYPDLDSGWSHSLGFAKTTWNQADILDLIDAVKTVEDRQLLNGTPGKSKTGRGTSAGNKWQQVAELLPNCWMSSSDRFHLICRGKFQELRRNYQAMLRNNSVCKFFTEEVCQKMRDYVDEVPPPHFFEGCEDSVKRKLIDSGCSSPRPKGKCMRSLKSMEVNNSRSPKSTCSESGELHQMKGSPQQLRRSPRVPKKSYRLEPSSEQVEMVGSPRKFASPESRSSRSSRSQAGGSLSRSDLKRARLEIPEDHDEQIGETVSDLFKKNFDLLRSNIDFSTEFHLHKHLHKHFNVFEERMTGLIGKLDKKIEKLDRKFEQKMGCSSLPSE